MSPSLQKLERLHDEKTAATFLERRPDSDDVAPTSSVAHFVMFSSVQFSVRFLKMHRECFVIEWCVHEIVCSVCVELSLYANVMTMHCVNG